MATCSGEELEVTWAREKDTLRYECHVKLRQALLNLAQAQMLRSDEELKTSHAPENKTVTDLQQKLETITLSGKRLSHVFMNSLTAAIAHRFSTSSTLFRDNRPKDLATEKSSATQEDDAYHREVSGRTLLASSPLRSEIKSQALYHCTETISRHPQYSHMITATKDEYPLPDNCALGTRPVDGTLGHDAQTQLAALVRTRADLYRQLSEQRTRFAKHSIYMRECRAAAEKEKTTVEKTLAAAKLSLATAEIERAIAANDRATALEELKHVTFLGDHSQPPKIHTNLEIKSLEGSKELSDYSVPSARAMVQQLRLGVAPPVSLPLLTCASTSTTLTPPESPDDTESTSHSGDSSSIPAVTASDKRMSPKPLVELNGNLELRDPAVIGHSGVEDDVETVSGTLENPIGPYIRPPMPLEDMLKCVRCLFGKDKSLKTGNRARAFLGVPWSEIVSFDPDVLLGRGVLGIKEGSTGMASRLRMMTIIESALSNQNDDTILPEVWEKPTHFCESCQKRYPITVSTNEAVPPFEESTQRMINITGHQVSSQPKIQETGGAANSKGKRNRKRLRLARPATHRLR